MAVTNKAKLKEMEKQIERYQKHCGTLKEENEKLARRAIEAERGAREIASSVDAIIAQIAIHYGDKAFDPDAPEKQIGYRITVPVIDIKAITEKYEVHAMKNEKGGTYVIAVGLRDDPDDHKRDSE